MVKHYTHLFDTLDFYEYFQLFIGAIMISLFFQEIETSYNIHSSQSIFFYSHATSMNSMGFSDLLLVLAVLFFFCLFL
ncbi:hypothetical protein CLU79DRAFT_128646 [Phycomyces nitens]|nr:hypothetical protein CLU79DRAFT_128646 [Phycomyces nitens]